MDLERLNAFRAVAMERSFTRAAKKVYKTQPAVSQAVRSLEEEVGERLFHRLGRTVELTEAGRVLLEHAEQAFDALEQGCLRIDSIKGLRAGTLRVATSDTTACYILPPALGAFRRRYPGIEIVISNRPSPVVLQEVLSREADIGIVTLPVVHRAVSVKALLVREDVVICSPGNRLSGRKRASLKDLEGYPLLLLDKGSNTRTFIDEQLRKAEVAPTIAMELGSIEVIKRLVQLDFGVSIVPRASVLSEVDRGLLSAVAVFRRRDARRLGAIFLRKRALSLAAREFLRVLTQHLGTRQR